MLPVPEHATHLWLVHAEGQEHAAQRGLPLLRAHPHVRWEKSAPGPANAPCTQNSACAQRSSRIQQAPASCSADEADSLFLLHLGFGEVQGAACVLQASRELREELQTVQEWRIESGNRKGPPPARSGACTPRWTRPCAPWPRNTAPCAASGAPARRRSQAMPTPGAAPGCPEQSAPYKPVMERHTAWFTIADIWIGRGGSSVCFCPLPTQAPSRMHGKTRK